VEPPAVFTAYKLVKVDSSGNQTDLTEEEFQEFERRYPKHAEWTQNSNPKNTQWHKMCFKLLKNVLRDKDVKMFKDPVNPVVLNIPDYPKFVRHPMDFGTIDQRLNSEPCYYTNPHDFIADMRMVFRDCYVYNQAHTHVWKLAEALSRKFEEQLASFSVAHAST
jgi:bromodomain-containing factor 1